MILDFCFLTTISSPSSPSSPRRKSQTELARVGMERCRPSMERSVMMETRLSLILVSVSSVLWKVPKVIKVLWYNILHWKMKIIVLLEDRCLQICWCHGECWSAKVMRGMVFDMCGCTCVHVYRWATSDNNTKIKKAYLGQVKTELFSKCKRLLKLHYLHKHCPALLHPAVYEAPCSAPQSLNPQGWGWKQEAWWNLSLIFH